MAYYFGFAPLLGALGFSLVAAVIIGLVSLRSREHEDTLIGALWSAGMAIGLIFVQLTPGYAVGLENYLFGNILLVSAGDLTRMLVLTALILGCVAFLYKEFLAVSVDDEFANLRGVPVAGVYILLLSLVALTIVILIQVVGVILLIALLTLPPAISRWFTEHINSMMAAALGIGLAFICSRLRCISLVWRPAPRPALVCDFVEMGAELRYQSSLGRIERIET